MNKQPGDLVKTDPSPTPEEAQSLMVQYVSVAVIIYLNFIAFGFTTSPAFKGAVIVLGLAGCVLALSFIYYLLKNLGKDDFWSKNWAPVCCCGLSIVLIVICAKALI